VDSKLVTIRQFPAMVHAELAKSALAAYEMDAAINDGVRVGGSGTIDLLVREEDVEAALEILGPEERYSD
jgi:hypothetical protein